MTSIEEINAIAQDTEETIRDAVWSGGKLNKKMTSARIYDMYIEGVNSAIKKKDEKLQENLRTVYVVMLVVLEDVSMKTAAVVAHVVAEKLVETGDLRKQFRESPFASFAAAHEILKEAVKKINFDEEK